MFKPGEQVYLRRGNARERVTFVRMSETPLGKPTLSDPKTPIQAYPGPSPTAVVRRSDGCEKWVLLEKLEAEDS